MTEYYYRAVLRSLIKFKEDDDLRDNIEHINCFAMGKLLLEATPDVPMWGHILQFVGSYYAEYRDYPHVRMVEATFADQKELDALSELPHIEKHRFETSTSFRRVVDKLREIAIKCIVADHMKMAMEILLQRKKVNHVWKEGPLEAMKYLYLNAEPYLEALYEEPTQKIEATDGIDEILAAHDEAESGSYELDVLRTGFPPIDSAIPGLKRKQVMVVAAHTAECKTTFSLNLAHKAVRDGKNVFFVSLEMTKQEVLEKFYSIHANYLAELSTIKKLSTEGTLPPPKRITVNAIRTGTLGDARPWYNFAISKNLRRKGGDQLTSDIRSYGRFDVLEVRSVTVKDIKRELEKHVILTGKPIDLLVIDYPGLMEHENDRLHNPTEKLNQIMKEIKRLAGNFNRREGVPIICPFQTNRESKKELAARAAKSKEPIDAYHLHQPVYSSYHLSLASEAERSADYVIYTFLNKELRENRKIHIGCIKNRFGDCFAPFIAEADLATSRIYYQTREEQSVEEIEL